MEKNDVIAQNLFARMLHDDWIIIGDECIRGGGKP